MAETVENLKATVERKESEIKRLQSILGREREELRELRDRCWYLGKYITLLH